MPRAQREGGERETRRLRAFIADLDVLHRSYRRKIGGVRKTLQALVREHPESPIVHSVVDRVWGAMREKPIEAKERTEDDA